MTEPDVIFGVACAVGGMLVGIPAAALFAEARNRVWKARFYTQLRESAIWREAYMNGIRSGDFLPPAKEAVKTEMCGGCGKFLTPVEIAACPGKDCRNFVVPNCEDLVIVDVSTTKAKKIPVGFNNFLDAEKPSN